MPTRRLIAALLSILLLVGGSAEGFASVASAMQNNVVECDQTVHVKAGKMGWDEPDVPTDCNSLQQATCCLSSAHCASMSVFGITTWLSLPPLQLSSDVKAVPNWTVYQDPIADVLTSPPNALAGSF